MRSCALGIDEGWCIVRFLSEEWLSAVGDVVAPLTADPESSCRLQFAAGDTRWYLVVDGGRVVDWSSGELSDRQAELRWDPVDAERIWHRRLTGNDAMAATTVATQAIDGQYVGGPAPVDLGRRPELAELPHIPDATLSVVYTYRKAPFGDVSYVLEFVDGRLVDQRLGTVDDPDVTIDTTYRLMGLVRTGRRSVLEALEHTKMDGRIGPMAALGGICESPEFHAAELATGGHALALATLGELWADPRFSEGMTALTIHEEA